MTNIQFPIFIGGTGRSGTTILKRVLSCHSKIVSLPDELRVINDPGGALDLISALSDNWSPYNADYAIHEFYNIMLACGRSKNAFSIYLEKIEKNLFRKLGFSPRRYLGVGLGKYFGYKYFHHRLDQLINDLTLNIGRGSWSGSKFKIPSMYFETNPTTRNYVEDVIRNFFCDLYANISSNEITHWVDDTPFNILFADDLLQVFPSMSLIHIYRDPRDVLASHLKFPWGGENIETITRRLAGIYYRWDEIRRSLPEERYIEVGLEKLSSEPRKYLNKICDFAGIEFEESLLKIKLNKVNADRWKREIPEAKISILEKYLGKYISYYGY